MRRNWSRGITGLMAAALLVTSFPSTVLAAEETEPYAGEETAFFAEADEALQEEETAVFEAADGTLPEETPVVFDETEEVVFAAESEVEAEPEESEETDVFAAVKNKVLTVDLLRAGAEERSITPVDGTRKDDAFGGGVHSEIYTYEANGVTYRALYIWGEDGDDVLSGGNESMAINIYGEDTVGQFTDLILDDTIARIDVEGVFYKLRKMSYLRLPKNLKSIAGAAFEDCESLAAITIPKTLEEISGLGNNSVFNGCVSLKEMTFENGIKIIPENFAGGRVSANNCGLTTVYIPPSVTEIGNNAFSQQENLTTVVFTDPAKTTLARIGSMAFYGTNLNSITLPKFGGSWKMEYVTKPQSPIIEQLAFGAITNRSFSTLIIPDGVKQVGQLMNGNNCFRYIYVPKSIEKQGLYYTFGNSVPASVKKIYYAGSKAEFLNAFGRSEEEAKYYEWYKLVEFNTPAPSVVESISTQGQTSIVKYLDEVRYGETEELTISLNPKNHLDTTPQITSSDPTVATATLGEETEAGTMTLTLTYYKKIGETKILVSAGYGSLEINITVKNKDRAEKPYVDAFSGQGTAYGDSYAIGTLTPNAQLFYVVNGSEGPMSILTDNSNYSWDANSGVWTAKDSLITAYTDPLVVGTDITKDRHVLHAVAIRSDLTVSPELIASLPYAEEDAWGDVAEGDRAAFAGASEIPAGLWVPQAQLSSTGFVYNGKAQTFTDLHVYFGNRRLAQKTDYTLGYKNNVNAGDASADNKPTVTVTLKGDYAGKEDFVFAIAQDEIPGSSLEYTIANLASGSTAKGADLKLKLNGRALKKDVDYTIAYRKAGTSEFGAALSDAGAYDAQITGKGNYRGEVTLSRSVFVISTEVVRMDKVVVSKIAAQNMADWKDNSYVVEPSYEVTYQGQPLNASLYTADFMNNTAAGTASLILKGTGVAEGGMTVLGSKTVTFKINGLPFDKNNVTVQMASSYSYTGSVIDPSAADDFQVKYGSTVLVRDKDYTVGFAKEYKAAGKCSMTLNGKGIYAGKLACPFTIEKIQMTDAAVTVSHGGSAWDEATVTVPYAKKGAKPEVVVTYRGVTLSPADYTVAYANATKPASYTDAKAPTVTITGKGNFTGKTIKKFTIVKADISKLRMSVDDMVAVSKANKFSRKPVILDTNGIALAAGTDYDKVKDLTYTYDADTTVTIVTGKGKKAVTTSVFKKKGDPVGTTEIIPAGAMIRVTAAGKNFYEGSISGTFAVAPYSVKNLKFELRNKDGFTYTGRAITLSKSDIIVKVKSGRTFAEIPSADGEAALYFDIVGYTNNIKKGTAKVKIKAKNGYAGTATLSFKIKAMAK